MIVGAVGVEGRPRRARSWGADARGVPRAVGVLSRILLSTALLAGCEEGTGPGEPVVVPAECDGPAVTLDVGAMTVVGEGSRGCFTLPQGGHYAIAVLDRRWLDSARSGVEAPALQPFALRIATTPSEDPAPATGHAPRARTVPVKPGTGSAEFLPHLPRTVFDSDPECEYQWSVACQAEPWEKGDTIVLVDRYFSNGEPAADTTRHVVVGLSGPLVFSVSLADPATQAWAGTLVEQGEQVGLYVIPLLRRMLGEEIPVTSPGSGQMLIMLVDVGSPGGGVALTRYDSFSARSHIRLGIRDGLDPAVNPPNLVSLMTHELTHAWAALVYRDGLRRHGGPPDGYLPRPRWSTEGVASFVTLEVARRLSGYDLEGNLDLTSIPREGMAYTYRLGLGGGKGVIPAGYDDAAAFFRYLLPRLAETEGGVDEAVGAIFRRSLEGWYGGRHPEDGFSEVTTRAFGTDPERVLLLYALAHALDDRTNTRNLQDLGVREAWRDRTAVWASMGTLQLDRPKERGRSANPWGSLLYAYVEASGDRPVFVSSDGADLAWAVARWEAP